MTTEVLPDVEAIEHLDFEPPCESRNCRVGHPPATHIGFYDLTRFVCTCLGTDILLFCPHCVKRISQGGPTWRCSFCGARVQAERAEDFVRFEPLP